MSSTKSALVDEAKEYIASAKDIQRLRQFVPSFQQPFSESVAAKRVDVIRDKWRLYRKLESTEIDG